MNAADRATLVQAAALADAFRQGAAEYWLRRARELDAARPRVTDRVVFQPARRLAVDWDVGWPTECTKACIKPPRSCRHPRRAVQPNEIPDAPPLPAPLVEDFRRRWDDLTEAAAACRARATGADGWVTVQLLADLDSLAQEAVA